MSQNTLIAPSSSKMYSCPSSLFKPSQLLLLKTTALDNLHLICLPNVRIFVKTTNGVYRRIKIRISRFSNNNSKICTGVLRMGIYFCFTIMYFSLFFNSSIDSRNGVSLFYNSVQQQCEKHQIKSLMEM